MSIVTRAVLKRLPDKFAILSLYAVIVTLVYTWTLAASFWKVPSWLFYLNLGQLAVVYAYSLLVNFLESVLLLAGFILVSLLLPASWWKSVFVPRSVMLLIFIMGSLFLSALKFRDPNSYAQIVDLRVIWWVVTFAASLPLVWIASRVGWIERTLESIADRCIILLMLYLPLTGISLVVVLARSIF
jgi:hypothetical protein